jgi:hypothetical protein
LECNGKRLQVHVSTVRYRTADEWMVMAGWCLPRLSIRKSGTPRGLAG